MNLQRLCLSLFFLFLSLSLSAEQPIRPVHTYSIVARDPNTGEMGVAVQSHWFSVGSIVSWAEAGVGAVATQSFVDPAYGTLGLALMRTGKTAQQALAAVIASDPGESVRQVAMIDSKGNVSAHTGKKCIPAAGHFVGKDFSVQANMMVNERVWPAMAQAYQNASGDLAEKMLAALDAAQSVGGDIRGKQSAAILVVNAKNTGRSWQDRKIDLRVEDHAEPLKELRRLLQVHRAYQHMNAGDLAMEHNDMQKAMLEYGAAQRLLPDSAEILYWYAVGLVNVGKIEEALPIFRKVFAMDRNWIELTRRLPGVDLLKTDDATLQKILSAAK